MVKEEVEECMHGSTTVVGLQTPVPKIKKPVSARGTFINGKIRQSKSKAVLKVSKTNLPAVSEHVETSLYYTRSINHQVLSAIKLLEGEGGKKPRQGKEYQLGKNGRETGEWRDLLRKAIHDESNLVEEIPLFGERVRSFICEVSKIQGQREYFPWKGSVVDSVVGAFLTQRTTDTLSSSAFMSLGSSFPQYRDCDAYSRHHRMLREQRPTASLSCQKVDRKSRLMLAVQSRKSVDAKEKEPLRKKRVSRKRDCKPDWSTLRTQYSANMDSGRSINAVDYVDWHAVRHADVNDISNAIISGGMNQKLALRIKDFLNRLVKDHGNLDLEWVRNLPPHRAKEFLLSIYGLGPKSVECVQLLTLKQHAFPVDINVVRVTVRLGWVPVPQSGDDLLMSVLEEVSSFHDLISQYLSKRLSEIDHESLYKLHYHMITFGKVFCTKQKPNCAECPMRTECKYYAETDIEDFGDMDWIKTRKTLAIASKRQQDVGKDREHFSLKDGVEALKSPLKDESVLKLRQKRKERTIFSPVILKEPNKSHTSALHYVYVLPDWFPDLEMFDDTDPDDSIPYLLITWEPTQGDTLAKSTLSSIPRHRKGFETVPGTILIPCRTALRGTFPLNGTYFQPNEVFADHQTSQMPINVRLKTLQQLPLQRLHCGSGLSNLVRGFPKNEVTSFFNEGYFCTRGFDRKTLAVVPLDKRLTISS